MHLSTSSVFPLKKKCLDPFDHKSVVFQTKVKILLGETVACMQHVTVYYYQKDLKTMSVLYSLFAPALFFSIWTSTFKPLVAMNSEIFIGCFLSLVAFQHYTVYSVRQTQFGFVTHNQNYENRQRSKHDMHQRINQYKYGKAQNMARK